MSSLSTKSIKTLLALLEEKLSCLEVFDRKDAREKPYLEGTRRELVGLMRRGAQTNSLLPRAMAAAA